MMQSAVLALTCAMSLVWPAAGQNESAPSSGAERHMDWTRLIPSIEKLLDAEVTHRRDGVRIDSQADVTGDGIPEALVNIAAGGAYTDRYAVVRLENGAPVLARFKQAHGKGPLVMFAQGSSVMHGLAVKFAPQSRALFSGQYTVSGSGDSFSKCNGDAYRWNDRTRTFEHDKRLSTILGQQFCREKAKELGIFRKR